MFVATLFCKYIYQSTLGQIEGKIIALSPERRSPLGRSMASVGQEDLVAPSSSSSGMRTWICRIVTSKVGARTIITQTTRETFKLNMHNKQVNVCLKRHTEKNIYYVVFLRSLVNLFILLDPFVRGMHSLSIKALNRGVSCINMQYTPRHNGV